MEQKLYIRVSDITFPLSWKVFHVLRSKETLLLNDQVETIKFLTGQKGHRPGQFELFSFYCRSVFSKQLSYRVYLLLVVQLSSITTKLLMKLFVSCVVTLKVIENPAVICYSLRCFNLCIIST